MAGSIFFFWFELSEYFLWTDHLCYYDFYDLSILRGSGYY